MKLSFLGAAREVTGSCVLVETADCRFLVDCGMFQGGREAPARNRRRFEFEPHSFEHGWPGTGSRFAKDAHGRIPGTVVPVQHPSPFALVTAQQPHGFA